MNWEGNRIGSAVNDIYLCIIAGQDNIHFINEGEEVKNVTLTQSCNPFPIIGSQLKQFIYQRLLCRNQ